LTSTSGEEPTSGPRAAWEILEASFQRLFHAAAQQGRDWKFISALFSTITEIIRLQGNDALVPSDEAQEGRRLRPELRARIEAVIDSFSDDEAADFLGIGTRQVRRRAQEGSLYFFSVSKKRRYATWQFDEAAGVLPGLSAVVAAIPASWTPEATNAFMTTTAPGLAVQRTPTSPRTWLAGGLDPAGVTTLIRDGMTESDSNSAEGST
jgi:hypothetical protein